jgi:hypothetical protein
MLYVARFTLRGTMIRLLRLLVIALPLSGCDFLAPNEQSPAQIRFETDQSEYRSGEQASARIENRSRAGVSYNLCMTSIERFQDGEWVQAGPFGPGLCQAIALGLGPGKAAEYKAMFRSDLTPGSYRLRTNVGFKGGERVEITTGAFAVLAPA